MRLYSIYANCLIFLFFCINFSAIIYNTSNYVASKGTTIESINSLNQNCAATVAPICYNNFDITYGKSRLDYETAKTYNGPGSNYTCYIKTTITNGCSYETSDCQTCYSYVYY